VASSFVSFLQAFTAVEVAKAALKNARAALLATVVSDGAAIKTLRSTIAGMYSDDAAILSVLDIAPKKPRTPLSTAARAARAAKVVTTRKARGTTSKTAVAPVRS